MTDTITDLPPRPTLEDCPLDDQGHPTAPPPGWEYVFLGQYEDGRQRVTAGWTTEGRFVCYDAEGLAAGFREHVAGVTP